MKSATPPPPLATLLNKILPSTCLHKKSNPPPPLATMLNGILPWTYLHKISNPPLPLAILLNEILPSTYPHMGIRHPVWPFCWMRYYLQLTHIWESGTPSDHCVEWDIRRKFRSQTSDNMDRWKAEQGRVREKRKIRRKKSRRERVRRKQMQMREKVGKSRNTVFFQWFVAPEGRKVGSLKRRVRSQLARWEMKNWTPLWREAHLQVKMYKAHQLRTTFTSWDVEKVHAVVARSTFGRQNVKNTRGSDHFWKFRSRKSARRCGAKHIWKSKW